MESPRRNQRIVAKQSAQKYVDPDVASIIDRSGGLIDPYEVVRMCVNSLLQKLGEFEASFDSAFGAGSAWMLT